MGGRLAPLSLECPELYDVLRNSAALHSLLKAVL